MYEPPLQEEDTLKWLKGIEQLGSKPGLKVVRELLKLLDDPQDNYKTIHVTGTNGKGSTSAMIANILIENGLHVGLFTSPHLSVFTESIKVNNVNISIPETHNQVEVIRSKIQLMQDKGIRHPTHFEVLTALAFKYFEERGVDFAVVEVGMGGRDDATNVINPEVSVITNIGLEHTKWLGDTKLEIARVKGGIIKTNRVLVTATEDDEVYSHLRKMAKEKNSKIIRVGTTVQWHSVKLTLEGMIFSVKGINREYDALFTPLLGEHQVKNAACAVTVIEALEEEGVNILDGSIRRGLNSVSWPGRLEIMERSPLIFLDGAKDVEAVKAIVKTIKEIPHGRLITVLSISSDKDIHFMTKSLSTITDHFIITKHRVKHRVADPHLIGHTVESNGVSYEIIENPKEGIEKAKHQATEEDIILITGSIFLVGEAREYWHPPSQEYAGNFS